MATGRRTRILIVDDSSVTRGLLRSVIYSDPGLEVAGTAADGASALKSIELLRPDLILLDVEMPVMDGLATLRQLRARGNRMPVIMCSSLTLRGARVTIEALSAGASDYVTKPAGQSDREAAIRVMAQELTPKIHALVSHAREQAQGQPQPVFPGAARVQAMLTVPQPALPAPAVLAIGVSTGGPAALDVLLPALPADFPLPVMIVQHMPEVFTRQFAAHMDCRCSLHVREAAEAEPVCAGTVYIARGDWHMEVAPASRGGQPPTVHLNQGPFENHCRPAVDLLFRSLAEEYGSAVLAVVLTGMGSDGLAGCRMIREQGGIVLAQDRATSTVWGMPGAVTHAGLAQIVLPLHAIAPEILRLTNRMHGEIRELRRSVV